MKEYTKSVHYFMKRLKMYAIVHSKRHLNVHPFILGYIILNNQEIFTAITHMITINT